MRTVSKWLVMAAAVAVGMLAQAELVTNSFTTVEGFVSGGLDGQKGWSAMAGWTVDPSGSGKATVSNPWQRATHSAALKMNAGESLTFRTEFKLLGDVVAPTANTTLMMFGIREDDKTDAPDIFHDTVLALRGDNVTLRGRNNVAPTLVLGSIEDHGTANLAVEYTLNVGTSLAESTFGMKITNIDTGDSETGSMKMDGDIYTRLTSGSGAYIYLNSLGYSQNDSGVTGIDVFSTTVIPEPATVGMLGLGAVIMMAMRRKLTR